MMNVRARFMRGGAIATGLLCLAGVTACGSDNDTPPVKVGPGAYPAVMPGISAQPKPQTVQAGQSATFAVSAVGDRPLTYQWTRNAVPIPGATLSTYTTAPVTLADSGDVLRVVVRAEPNIVLNSDPVPLLVDGAGARVLAGGAAVPASSQVDGVGKEAYFLSAGPITGDYAGNLLLLDAQNVSVRKITPAGVVTTAIVGAGTPPVMQFPRDVAAGANGAIYVIDSATATAAQSVKKIGADRAVSTLDLGATQGDPVGANVAPPAFTALTSDAAGNLYVASEVTRPGEPECSSCFKRAIVRKVAPDGKVTIVFESTGPHSSAPAIIDLAVDKNGTLYVVDRGIRKVDASGVATTLLGTDQAFVNAIALDSGGNLYFATEPFSGRPSSWPLHAIGKIAPDGKVTVAADPNGSDARFKSAAWITRPAGLVLDAAGALYVSGNGRVLKLVLP